jgi:hypothetical protein
MTNPTDFLVIERTTKMTSFISPSLGLPRYLSRLLHWQACLDGLIRELMCMKRIDKSARETRIRSDVMH